MTSHAARLPGLGMETRAAIAAAVAGVLVGAAIVATRFVIDQTTPAALAFLRYLIGLLCLLPVLTIARRAHIAPRDLLPVALLGIGQFGILIVLLNYGLTLIPSARAALILSSFPLLTLMLAVSIGIERFTWRVALGVLATIAGVALALGDKLETASPVAVSFLGEGAVLAAAFTGALCSVFYGTYLRRYPVLPVSVLAMFASVLFLGAVAAWEGFFAGWPRFTPGGWAAVVFIGVGSGVGYYLWLWALTHTSPTRVTVFLCLSPVTAAVLGALLLAEPVSLLLVAGVASIGTGLWLTHSHRHG
ncbi:MAG: DMT family transporter [Gammaproteobacteria bacterium]|nr:DMT family transporter [Gammaproteobacteria bacterium]